MERGQTSYVAARNTERTFKRNGNIFKGSEDQVKGGYIPDDYTDDVVRAIIVWVTCIGMSLDMKACCGQTVTRCIGGSTYESQTRQYRQRRGSIWYKIQLRCKPQEIEEAIT